MGGRVRGGASQFEGGGNAFTYDTEVKNRAVPSLNEIGEGEGALEEIALKT